MESNRSYLLLVPSLVLATSLFLSGCKGASQATARLATSEKPDSTPEGVSEKYTPEQKAGITDVVRLSAYQEKLSKLFERLDKDAVAPWSAIIHLKKWLFTPQVLSQDLEKSIALKFMNGEASVLGMQTLEDIWVRKDLFLKMSPVDQGDFLLNEILTHVYILKMLSNEELCGLIKKAHRLATDCSFVDKAGADLADQENALIASSTGKAVSATAIIGVKKRLDQNDYHNIAIIKSYIQQAGDELNQASLLAKMTANGFDTRAFKVQIQESATDSNPLILAEEHIESLFAQAGGLEQKQTCHFLQLGLQGPCELVVQRRIEEIPGTDVQRSLLETALQFNQSDRVHLSKQRVFQVKETEAVLYTRTATKDEFYIVTLPGLALESRVVGKTYTVTALVAQKVRLNSVTKFKLLGLAEMPGVITRTTQDPKTKKIVCEGQQRPVQNAGDDIVIVGIEATLALELRNSLVQLTSVPPCW